MDGQSSIELNLHTGNLLRHDYADAAKTLRNAQQSLEAMERTSKTGQCSEVAELESVRAQFRKADGSYSAYMCKRCGYGPIDHGKCNDLTAHHHQAIGGGWIWSRHRISNNCPQCGWFASNIKKWPAWDGKTLGCGEPKVQHKLTKALAHAAPSRKAKVSDRPKLTPSSGVSKIEQEDSPIHTLSTLTSSKLTLTLTITLTLSVTLALTLTHTLAFKSHPHPHPHRSALLVESCSFPSCCRLQLSSLRLFWSNVAESGSSGSSGGSGIWQAGKIRGGGQRCRETMSTENLAGLVFIWIVVSAKSNCKN